MNTCLSGGCRGADTVFGEQAVLAGHTVVHWSFGGHHSKCKDLVYLNSVQLSEADKHLIEANKILKRHYPSRFIYTNNLLRRNYYQIKDTERIYAVSSLDANGRVKGGTGWTVAMGILHPVKDIYFFDQEKEQWLRYIGEQGEWEWIKESSVPKPYGVYTGIGASELDEAGKQAIISLYEK